MRVVSMIPSVTETLLECGVEVAARTRYCIHPREKIKSIPVIGGTKDLDLEQLAKMKIDLLILDKEENLPWMAEKSPCATFVMHVHSIASAANEFKRLGERLTNQKLIEVGERYARLTEVPQSGVSVVYVIWMNPWMSVNDETYIGDVLKKLGKNNFFARDKDKYPKFDMESLPENVQLLFSTEPFPFHKKRELIRSLSLKSEIVDGEKYSWFGIRSLRALEKLSGF